MKRNSLPTLSLTVTASPLPWASLIAKLTHSSYQSFCGNSKYVKKLSFWVMFVMDYGRETGFSPSNVVQILTGPQSNNDVPENWDSGVADQGVWATEDDYCTWNREASVDTTSNSNYDGRQSQTRSGSEPPNKKSRNSQVSDSRSKAIGKMFFKTKRCCKFRAGTCPYITNCNFAHSTEELRSPPSNWQEIVAACEDERAVSSEQRVAFQIPTLESSAFVGETPRSYKGRHCKKFYTEEGCPYGDNCTFLHDEQSKARESVAISLGPGSGREYAGNANGSNVKPSNWKTRICNKWELTGYCPFGSKCHFAHGAQGHFGQTLAFLYPPTRCCLARVASLWWGTCRGRLSRFCFCSSGGKAGGYHF
ncbi:zinc finger CCCH domain-containing protein 12-like isoform X2 [Diospyros lotus]|uniref:zinc finger CCCH domain-containing protein 12-like isoform X2 n=1 Tax=Diospyros lotus TaxID=55363 RepID=UPI002254A887|nr:zinc finger CCCH domain-containing protein 12-like isoform X2 [Diospyros lotus]